jgi:glycosyltransferase involved in cell wall biosynthesis
MEKVSIVIITYNRPELLKKAINSALIQTYPKIEIIVVDDNSTYDVSEFLRNYYDKITLIKNNKNIGPSGSRNIGIENCTGEFITFLDDDDIFHPKKIESQINLFKKNKEIGLVYCPLGEIKKNKLIYRPLDSNKNKWIRLKHQNYIGITPLIKKECFSTCGVFDTSLDYHEDRDLWYRISKKYKFGLINIPGYICYSFSKERLSTDIEKICENKKILFEKHKKDFENKDLCYSDLNSEMAFIYLIYKDYKNFLRYFNRSFKNKFSSKFYILGLNFKWFSEFLCIQTKFNYKKIKIDQELKEILEI